MPTRWGIGDGSTSTAGRIVLNTDDKRKGCTPDNECGCGPPPFCNKWLLFFSQACEGAAVNDDGEIDTSEDGTQFNVVASHIFVDLSSIPTEVTDPPPQAVDWHPTFGSTRSASIPGTTTGPGFVAADSDTCTREAHPNPFSTGCDRRRVLSSDGIPGYPADCTDLSLGPAHFTCDPKATKNVVSDAPQTQVTVAGTSVDVGSDGQHLDLISTLHVVDASNFPSSGTVEITGRFGSAFGTYTGKTGTTLTGFSSGSIGVVHTGDSVAQLYVLSASTVFVVDTTGYPSSGKFLVDVLGGGTLWAEVAYTGKTGTTFTGCTGGPNVVAVNGRAVYAETSGSIDSGCSNPAPDPTTVTFYYTYIRVSGADCHLSESELVAAYWPY